MRRLVFPERVTIRARLINNDAEMDGIGLRIAFSIRTFARSKNDYHLGPFFTDDTGALALTRQQLKLSAQAALSSGLMDYASISDGFPLVEISHLSAADIERAIKSRTTHWTQELDGERELYGSVGNLVACYQGASNGQLAPPSPPFSRDEWDGSKQTVEYEYSVLRRRKH